MNLFRKNTKVEKLECKIKTTIEHLGEKYTLANYNNGYSSFDFEVSEIAHIDDGHINCLKGMCKSKNHYLPLDPYGKHPSSLAIKDCEFSIFISEDPQKEVQNLSANKYKIDEEKLIIDFATHLHTNGIATLFLDGNELFSTLRLKEEIYQKIYSGIKTGSVSKMQFQLTFFNLYKSDSDKDSDILYLNERTGDSSYTSHGLFKNLIIEKHKTIIS